MRYSPVDWLELEAASRATKLERKVSEQSVPTGPAVATLAADAFRRSHCAARRVSAVLLDEKPRGKTRCAEESAAKWPRYIELQTVQSLSWWSKGRHIGELPYLSGQHRAHEHVSNWHLRDKRFRL